MIHGEWADTSPGELELPKNANSKLKQIAEPINANTLTINSTNRCANKRRHTFHAAETLITKIQAYAHLSVEPKHSKWTESNTQHAEEKSKHDRPARRRNPPG